MKVPENLKIKLAKRSDTFTGILGFINYVTDKGDWKFKKSFDNWGGHKVEEFVNEPTSGFVINTNVGGHSRGSWFSDYGREMKIRVWDPRGWEIEITLDNFFENILPLGVTAGKGIEHELVYVFNDTRLMLMSSESSEVKAILNEQNNHKNAMNSIDVEPFVYVKGMTYEVGKVYFHNPVDAYVYAGKRKFVEYDKMVTKNVFLEYNTIGKSFKKNDGYSSFKGGSNGYSFKTSISPTKIINISKEPIFTKEELESKSLPGYCYPIFDPKTYGVEVDTIPDLGKGHFIRLYCEKSDIYVFIETNTKSYDGRGGFTNLEKTVNIFKNDILLDRYPRNNVFSVCIFKKVNDLYFKQLEREWFRYTSTQIININKTLKLMDLDNLIITPISSKDDYFIDVTPICSEQDYKNSGLITILK